MLPAQRNADVAVTRCPWSVIASAPPAHSALTTDWMSCWCTTRSSGGSPRVAAVRGASSSETDTPAPRTGVVPAETAVRAARSGSTPVGASSDRDRSATSAVRASTWVARSATRSDSRSTSCARFSGWRDSSPRASRALAVNMSPASARTSATVTADRTRRARVPPGPGDGTSAGSSGPRRRGPWCSRDRLLPGADAVVDRSASCVCVVGCVVLEVVRGSPRGTSSARGVRAYCVRPLR